MTEPESALTGAPKLLIDRIESGETFTESCPAHEVLKHVTSRWGVLILIVLRRGSSRFSELRRKINGVSEKMLAHTLQLLTDDGFICKQIVSEKPLHIDYSLTKNGVIVSCKIEELANLLEINSIKTTDMFE